MSSRERLARLAEAAEIERKEKEAKKAAREVGGGSRKPTGAGRTSSAAKPRVRFVWAVCDPSGAHVARFAYAQKDAAEAEAQRLTKESGHLHFVAKAEEAIG